MSKFQVSPNFLASTDPLAETLHSLRLSGSLYCSAEMREPWGVRVPSMKGMMTFQIVTAGRCWLELENAEPLLLETGSFTLMPHATAHCMKSRLEADSEPLFDIPINKISERYETMSFGGSGQLTRVTYGVMKFDHIAGQRLVASLPELLHFDSWDDTTGHWLQSTVRFIVSEAGTLRPGGETVITRLADVLVIQAIRLWLDTAEDSRQGWLAALRDDKIGKALAAMHREPEQPWSVATLAEQASMSRSVFSDRFTSLVGTSVLRYLTDWRLQLARAHLHDTSDPLKVIAELVGYGSEAAFCRAFKQHYGMSPGSTRSSPNLHDRVKMN